jgi:hypothetical protein
MKAQKRKRPGDPEKWGKLTDQLQARLVARIEEGLAFQTCCDLCGLARSTFYEWIDKGQKEPESRHGIFAQAVARAEAEAIRRLHIRVEAADPAWLLSRRHPDLYGPPKTKTETELSGGITMEQKGKFELTISCTGEVPVYPIVDSRTLQPINGAATGNGTNGNHDSTR